MAADTAANPWLLRAPPWTGEHDDGSQRAPKRARADTTTMATPTRAEETLRKYAFCAADKLATIGDWELFVKEERGQADIAEDVHRLPHKAARLLDHLRRRGASVPLHTAPWTWEQLHQAALRGSHRSAKDEVEFVCQEMLEFCQQGFWIVLPLQVALTLPHLRLSPLGVVPQRNRRPRLIVDYTYSGVNEETARIAPPEAMQFGKALQRILRRLVHANPRYGPVWLAKIDIADGFYRISLRPSHVPRLAVILPTTTAEPLVALPLALPMGWVESPPYFTAVTETACDLLNAALQQRAARPPPHRLESVAATPPAGVALPGGQTSTFGDCATRLAPEGTPERRTSPLTYGDVYVDDFILAAQTEYHKQRTMRWALHAIDAVLRPVASTDRPSRKEPVSVKKLLQGDACWSTRKTVLGWDLDTTDETLRLPPHRLERLYSLLDAYPSTRKRVPITEWHQLLGELRSMVAALPGARGLFSTLQDALRNGDSSRVRLNRRVFDSLRDFRAIADSLRSRPTRFRELVPVGEPVAHGACDACRRGMGGVWFLPGHPPMVWRAAFPPAIQRELVTGDHKTGTISISDLELSGTLAHVHALTQVTDVAERPIWLAGDNRASLAWATKGSATASTARAYLLRLSALHQRFYRYVPQYDYIPGPANVMADDASRRWDLSDADLLSHFNSSYAQADSWTILTLAPEIRSALTGALLRQRSTPTNLRIGAMPQPPPGASGKGFVPPPASAPFSLMSQATRSPSSSSLPINIARDASLPVIDPSALVRWRTPYAMWRRRSPGWGPRTLA